MKTAPILFINQLTTIDFSYLDQKRGLLGESWLVDIELEGILNEQSMLFDFSPAKKVIKQLIDQTIDHKLVVPKACQGYIPSNTDNADFEYQLACGARIIHKGPLQAVTLLDTAQISIEHTQDFLEQLILDALPDNIRSVKIRLYPESIAGAYYHYSHGLKKHDGNCQRIAHGHRSQIIILKDGERDEALERQWAERFRDIYIGSLEDLVSEQEHEGVLYQHYAYDACQGHFELTLPKRNCYVMEQDSTVEEIACHIAQKLAQQDPTHHYQVYAFEGVNKGAIAKS